MTGKWETYEGVATLLLNRFCEDFGLVDFQGKQCVQGWRSGTNWEIDAKGVEEDGEAFVIVECRRYTTSRQKQEHLAALAYRIIDTGSKGGIIVTPLGLQEGARKVAKSENITEVQLRADSTPEEFQIRFLDKFLTVATLRPAHLTFTAGTVSASLSCSVAPAQVGFTGGGVTPTKSCTACGAVIEGTPIDGRCTNCAEVD